MDPLSNRLGLLFPPMNYSAVEEGLHRSALPSELSYGFIKTLNIKTFLILSPQHVSEQFITFLDECSINAIFIENRIGSDFGRYSHVSEDTVVQALNVLLNESYYPVYVSCEFGKLLSGVVIGCLRKLQKWSLVSIFEEFRRFSNARLLEIEQFIELFDTDLVGVTARSPLFLRRVRLTGADVDQSLKESGAAAAGIAK